MMIEMIGKWRLGDTEKMHSVVECEGCVVRSYWAVEMNQYFE